MVRFIGYFFVGTIGKQLLNYLTELYPRENMSKINKNKSIKDDPLILQGILTGMNTVLPKLEQKLFFL